MSEKFIYDDVPYPSYSFPQTHPNQLAVNAKLLGLNPPTLERCRVLEIGCGNGSNLNWIAHTLPEGSFIGIDLSAKQIETAKQAADEIGLQNIKFYAEDIANISIESFDKFDYIIAHGVFSWVPDFVREKILQLYHTLLKPNGVGYISYNVYPGSHLGEITRNFMRLQVTEIAEPLKKIDEGRKFIELLRDSVEQESVYYKVIEQELKRIDNKEPMTLFHDDLAEFNQPFYFSDFIAEANKHGLQFLSEVGVVFPQTNDLPAEFREFLQNFSDDPIKVEQYLDFQKMRRFRQTLLVHSDVEIEREPNVARIKEFFIGSSVKCASASPDIQSEKGEKFVKGGKYSFELNHPLTKAMLHFLSSIWSQSVSFDELVENSSKLLSDNETALSTENITRATQLLFELFNNNFVELYLYQPAFVDQISNKPKISEFARFQAKTRNVVTGLNGSALRVEDDFVRSVIFLLDGTRRTFQILTELSKNPKLREIKHLPIHLDNLLLLLLKSGLLVD